MRAIVQRVSWAQVETGGDVVGRAGLGLLVYVAVAEDDTLGQAQWLADKIAHLRIFDDAEGKLNRSVQDMQGGILVISNFTLLADARKGRRPAFAAAAKREQAEPLTDAFAAALQGFGLRVETGVFGAEMFVRSEAFGPVNVVVDTPAEA